MIDEKSIVRDALDLLEENGLQEYKKPNLKPIEVIALTLKVRVTNKLKRLF